MKIFFSRVSILILFMVFCSFTTIKKPTQNNGFCAVKITKTDSETGETTSEYYYSTSRTSAEDCANGGWALANGFTFLASDFKRSPIILDMED